LQLQSIDVANYHRPPAEPPQHRPPVRSRATLAALLARLARPQPEERQTAAHGLLAWPEPEARQDLRFRIAYLQDEMLGQKEEAIATYNEILADDFENLQAIVALDRLYLARGAWTELAENLERIVPPKIDLVLDRAAWTVPPVFTWMRRLADVDPAEMDRVFNMGVGLVLVVSPFYAPKVREHFASCEIETFVLGTATVGTGHVCWRDEPA